MTETQTPETNAVPYFPHAAPKVPLTKRGWFIPVAIAGAFLIGAGGTGAVATTVATVKAANCEEAFLHAGTVIDASTNVISLLGDGLDAASSFDADRLDTLSSDIDRENRRLDGVPEKFDAAKNLCI